VTPVETRPLAPPIDIDAASLPMTVPQPGLPVPVAQPGLPTVATPTSSALAVARSTQDTFVRRTGAFGHGSNGPMGRWLDRHGRALMAGSFGSLGLGALTAVGTSMAGIIPGAEVVAVACGLMLAPVAGCIGALFATLGEAFIYRGRTLKRKDVEALRKAYDTAGTPLQKATIAEIAARGLRRLDRDMVKGEPPRVVLQSIVSDAKLLPEEARAHASVFARCLDICCDEGGDVGSFLSDYNVQKLENAIAESPEESRGDLCDALLGLLFKGERARPRMDRADEARLYRVLVGADAPRPEFRMEPSTLEGAALAEVATDLRAQLFRANGTRLPLDQVTAQKLLSVLAAAENNAKES
jgi:hypothetical protein